MTAAAASPATFAGVLPWVLLVGYGIVLLVLAPTARDAAGFYEGRDARGREPTLGFLFGSLFIAWIFAKSVTNAANLGAKFGVPGAVAYAAYWLSIPIAGLVILGLRFRFGARTLPGWLTARYGRGAAATFMLAILIRLYNEIWSNTAVIGSYFGAKGSAPYYAAALAFTALTLAYTLKGGLRSSIWTDAIQAAVFAIFLGLVLFLVVPRAAGDAAGGGSANGVARLVGAGSWTLAGGVDLLLVALLQSLSYPFHDPVLTDRAFLADAETTRRAFFMAGGFGALSITLFGLVGVSAFVAGTPVHDDAPRVVAAALGSGALVLVNVVMLTSAGSTIDSAFSSTAKAVSADVPALLGRERRVSLGRAAMVAIAILGNVPLFFGAGILKATTISGTMVLGLAPIFILGLLVNAPALSFHLAFWTGIAVGLLEVLGLVPRALAIGDGSYATLLGVNLWGLAAASTLFLAPVALRAAARRFGATPAVTVEGSSLGGEQRSSGAVMLSIVVPTLNEATTLPGLLGELRALRVVHEVIVADGGSTDRTREIAVRCGARVVRAAGGRGPQLRAGVEASRGEVLCVLHADARLSHEARGALERLANDCPDGVAHAFTLRIAGKGWRYRFVEWGTDRRSRWGKLPYGDQGLILTRATYERAGGFPPLALMEDVALVRRLGRQARVVILPERIAVSPRRWQKDGVLRRMLRNWLLLGAYLAGVSPDRLAAAYRPHSGAAGAA